MKFNTSSLDLSKALSIAANSISTKAIMPVLEDFLFVLEGNELTISATNLETSLILTHDVTGHQDGSIAVSAKLLLETLRTLPDQPITLEAVDNMVHITSSFGKYKMPCDDHEDFPKIERAPEDESIVINSSNVKKAIEKTINSIGESGVVKLGMTGVLFQLDYNKANFVSTDGHRLVKYTFKGTNLDTSKSFILPQKGLNLLKNALPEDGDVHISWNDKNAFFKFDNCEVISALISDDFPNYNNVIPANNENVALVNRKDLINSLRRLMIFANKSFNLVTFNINQDSLTLATEDPEFSHDATEQLPCKYDGESMTMGFSGKFFIELLSIAEGDEVRLELSNPKIPVLIKSVEDVEDEELVLLIMPLIMK